MGAVISQLEKRQYIPFVKSNFDNLSQRKIAKILGLGKTTLNRWAKELGLRFKKHTVNERFFDKFNEESSYILGFIFADGNIAWNTKKGYYSLTITSSEKDKNHLEAMRKKLSSTKPLLYSDKTRSYRLIVNSKKMCQRLMLLGVTPKKSLTVKFPNIPGIYLRHFIRGIIDGDGNVRYVPRDRSPYFEITISSGSRAFCEGLVKSIKTNVGVDADIRKVGKNTHLMQYSCSRGERLAKYIYSGANTFLERKYMEYNKSINGGRQK